VYAELGQRAATALHRDGGVVIDATFRRATDADAFAAASHAAAAAAWLVCEAPSELLLERARTRTRDGSISDAGPAIVAQELAIYRGPFLAPGPPLARLDTRRPTAALLADLAGVLDARLQATAASSPSLHVSPDRVGGWNVRREGESQLLSEHNSETDAENAAIRTAKDTSAETVVVHDRYDRVRQAKT
jgi:predicted kinase